MLQLIFFLPLFFRFHACQVYLHYGMGKKDTISWVVQWKKGSRTSGQVVYRDTEHSLLCSYSLKNESSEALCYEVVLTYVKHISMSHLSFFVCLFLNDFWSSSQHSPL